MTPLNTLLATRPKPYPFLASLCLFLTPALSLAVDSGYSYGAGVITILAIVFILTSLNKGKPSLSREDRLLLFTLITYFLIYALSASIDGMNSRDLDRPSRFVLAGLALIFLLNTSISPRFLLYGVLIGASGAGLLSLYQYIILDLTRPSGHHHSIAFGNDSQMLSLLCFVCAGYFLQTKKHGLVIFSVVAGILALIAFILSGTRGGWLAIPLFIYIAWQYKDLLSKKMIVIGSILFSIGIVATLQLPNISTLGRLQLATQNLAHYSHGESKTTSTGIRIEMWKSAWYSFLEKPIYGTGEHKNKEFKRKQIDQKLVHKDVIDFGHAHNELLTALSFRGIIGFISLLAIYLVPLYLFRKKLSNQASSKPFALGGITICLSYMIYGLTQSMFEHNSGTTIYAFMIVFYWAGIRQLEKDSDFT